jgi:uncharacterized protein (UPF0303 family)
MIAKVRMARIVLSGGSLLITIKTRLVIGSIIVT